MPRIVIESDHYLKILPVMLDPATPVEHCDAVADFFSHDVPDFLDWCMHFRARIPELSPIEIVFAESQAQFEFLLADADMAIVESFAVTREALAKAPRLKVVQKFGALASGIDVEAAREKHIAVLTLRREGNVAVAEQAFALMLALSKRIVELNGVVTAGDLRNAGYAVRPYDRCYTGGSNFARIPGLKTLAGATLGMVGMGEVGREVAARAGAFGMSIVYYQRRRAPAAVEMALGARYLALHQLMTESDYIVVQLPLNASTTGLIGREELIRIKPGAVLVNAARAALIDRQALVEALESGRLGGLGMDVGYEEPWGIADPLLKFRKGNVILMPHTAVGDRRVGLNDLSEMCLGICRALRTAKKQVLPNVVITGRGGL
jgi:lactate dehydrogenase-like 2-hydroxyacid dehydrogenase